MKRALFLVFLLGCKPDLGDRDSHIAGLRVLAVRGEPPEAPPGTATSYTVLAATPEGPITTPLASWAFCATPKLLTENGAVSAACRGAGVRAIADAPTVTATMPTDACSLFGPDVSAADLRPRDPDVTGGFYQPVRVTVLAGSTEEQAFGLERIKCNLANAPGDIVAAFAKRYVPNTNPTLGDLTASVDGAPVAFDALPAGASVTFRATWTAASAEPYVVYDLATLGIVDRRESLRVSWFATDGTFENDRTGRDETETETFSDNRWTAPSASTTSTSLFVVLRDARGGSAWATYTLRTR